MSMAPGLQFDPVKAKMNQKGKRTLPNWEEINAIVAQENGRIKDMPPFVAASYIFFKDKEATEAITRYVWNMLPIGLDGKQIERISPFGMDTGKMHLPAVLARRRANRGMEGLAITPDEKTLVGIMQSTLFNPSKKEISNKQLVRIVTFDIKTGSTKQYAYIQNKETDSTCGITTLSNTEFVVIERDGKFSGEKEAHKYLFKIDLKDATDITGENPESKEGLLINGKTLEQCTTEEIEAAGIKPVKKEFLVDLVEYLPNKYPHDKLEGLWVLDSNTIAVVNDNDFAINVENNQLVQKKLPGTDRIDNDVIYVIKLPRSLR